MRRVDHAALQPLFVYEDHVKGEIGKLLCGNLAGRRSYTDITLFESLGVALEDLTAARALLDSE